MTYFARVLEVITRTGGVTGKLYRLEAESGAEAVAKICSALGCGEGRVYLLSAEESAVWETEGVKVETI